MSVVLWVGLSLLGFQCTELHVQVFEKLAHHFNEVCFPNRGWLTPSAGLQQVCVRQTAKAALLCKTAFPSQMPIGLAALA